MNHLSTTAGACMRAAAGRLYSLRLHYRGGTTWQAGITCVISMVRGKRCPHARFKTGRASGLVTESSSWRRQYYVFSPSENTSTHVLISHNLLCTITHCLKAVTKQRSHTLSNRHSKQPANSAAMTLNVAQPTKEQIAKDPRAFSLFAQAQHQSSGLNQVSDLQKMLVYINTQNEAFTGFCATTPAAAAFVRAPHTHESFIEAPHIVFNSRWCVSRVASRAVTYCLRDAFLHICSLRLCFIEACRLTAFKINTILIPRMSS